MGWLDDYLNPGKKAAKKARRALAAQVRDDERVAREAETGAAVSANAFRAATANSRRTSLLGSASTLGGVGRAPGAGVSPGQGQQSSPLLGGVTPDIRARLGSLLAGGIFR